MTELKKKVESVLFATGRRMELDEIAKLVRVNELEKVEEVLQELKGEYEARDTSIHLSQDGTVWKLTIRDDYLSTVRKIVRQTELTKSVMETLAVVAYRAPVLQSDIIKIRTNKAYDHLSLLENQGFLSRVKKGRTKLIKLSQKFFEYFDVPPDKLKERFSNVAALETAVEEKEAEVEEQNKALDERRVQIKKDEKEFKEYVETEHSRLDKEIGEMPEIDLVDDSGEEHELETYETKTKKGAPAVGDELETYETAPEKPSEEPSIEEKPKDQKKEAPTEEKKPDLIEEAKKEILEEEKKEESEEEQVKEAPPEPEEPTKEEVMEEKAEKIAAGEKGREFEGKGVFPEGIPEDIEHKIDERVEEIVHGEHEEPKEEEKTEEKE